MIKQDINLDNWKELTSLLGEENINYSLSLNSYLKATSKTESLSEEDLKISIFYTDFFKLYEKFPKLFVLPENNDVKNLSPFFLANNRKEKLYIDLIVGTDPDKINYWYKRNNYKRIRYWGNSKKSTFLKLLGKRYKKLTLRELIDSIKVERYNRLIVLSSAIEDFVTFLNLNLNNMEFIEIGDLKIPYFNDYKRYKTSIKQMNS